MFGHAEIDQYLERAMDAMSKVEQFQQEMETVAGRGEALDGRLTVSVDSGGKVTGVELDPRALRLASDDLAAAFVEAAQQAHDDLTERSRELMEELMPDMDVESVLRTDTEGIADDLRETMTALAQSSNPLQDIRSHFERFTAHRLPSATSEGFGSGFGPSW